MYNSTLLCENQRAYKLQFYITFLLSYKRNSNTVGRGTRVRNWRTVNQGRIEMTMLHKYFRPIQMDDFNKDR